MSLLCFASSSYSYIACHETSCQLPYRIDCILYIDVSSRFFIKLYRFSWPNMILIKYAEIAGPKAKRAASLYCAAVKNFFLDFSAAVPELNFIF